MLFNTNFNIFARRNENYENNEYLHAMVVQSGCDMQSEWSIKYFYKTFILDTKLLLQILSYKGTTHI
jgi:hypothetical protein